MTPRRSPTSSAEAASEKVPRLENGDRLTRAEFEPRYLDNEPQPDAFLRIAPDRGGQSRTSKDDIVEGAPELVAEVSSSTASYDLDQKLKVYRRNGVLEYLVWRVNDQAMDWFVLERGEYLRLTLDRSGYFQSRVCPGLLLDPHAITRGNPLCWPCFSRSRQRQTLDSA